MMSVQSPEAVPMGMAGGQPLYGTGSRATTPLDHSGNRSMMGSSGKRTFKDKLHSMIQEAEAAEVQLQKENQSHDKKSLAIATLVEGRPQAFVDFFHLTHGPDSLPARGANGEVSSSGSGELPQASLGLLKAQLIKAETASKAGDTEAVYGAYKSLAKHFAGLGRLSKAEFFFRRCLQLASDAHWLAGELEANLALGVVYEELGHTAAALASHERRLQLASDALLQPEMDSAFRSLTSVYLRQAEALAASGQTTAALTAYSKCLAAAHKAGNVPIAARADFELGMLHHAAGQWTEAMHYLGLFRELAGSVSDQAAEGVAHTTYAECLQKIGDTEGAVKSLEEYLAVARGHDPHGAAIACCSLGTLYYQQKQFEQSVKYFEKFFETARGLSERRIIDTARVNLGVARGTLRMQQYFDVVDSDLGRLIEWKCSRTPFADSQ